MPKLDSKIKKQSLLLGIYYIAKKAIIKLILICKNLKSICSLLYATDDEGNICESRAKQ